MYATRASRYVRDRRLFPNKDKQRRDQEENMVHLYTGGREKEKMLQKEVKNHQAHLPNHAACRTYSQCQKAQTLVPCSFANSVHCTISEGGSLSEELQRPVFVILLQNHEDSHVVCILYFYKSMRLRGWHFFGNLQAPPTRMTCTPYSYATHSYYSYDMSFVDVSEPGARRTLQSLDSAWGMPLGLSQGDMPTTSFHVVR